MKHSLLYSTLCACLLSIVGMAHAEDVVFRAQAPAQVVVGQPFQLTYTVNQRAKDLRAPEFDNFDYIAGPFSSQSTTHSYINGERKSTFIITYTYTLMAQREGTFTIAPATITVNRERYASNGVKITVLPSEEQQANTSSSKPQSSSHSASSTGQSSNIFMRTLVSKTKVYEQEAILLSYKVYVAGVDLKQFTNNITLPDFTSFLQQKIDLKDVQLEMEHYDGRNYQTATIYSTLLYPQKSGDIQISPAQFEAVLLVPNQARSRSIWDDFLNSYTTATRMLEAPGVTIHVSALPAGKPASYAGGVGHFTMDAKLSSTEVSSNEPITLTLTIRGSGNMKLLKTPAVDWPEGFEQYDPKVTNSFKTSAAGMSGTRTVEFLAIPRASGDYVLPPIEFSYFDTEKGTYQTLSTPEYALHIKRGVGETTTSATPAPTSTYVNKEDIRELGSDIRYISAARFTPPSYTRKSITFGSWQMLLLYLCPLAFALLLFVIFRKRIRENADLTRMRYKQANSVARKRLKKAKTLMNDTNKSDQFYEEIERASLQYLSDRLSIPTAELNKESITNALAAKQVDSTLIARTHEVLSNAAFARYAPAMGVSREQMYKQTEQLINDLENCKL